MASSRPSPVSSTLRQQLIHPSTYDPHIPNELQTSFSNIQLRPHRFQLQSSTNSAAGTPGLRVKRLHPQPQTLSFDLLAHCIKTLRDGYLFPSTDKVLESMLIASTLHYDPTCNASVSDISILSSDTLIYFLNSKTNQFGQPQPVYLFQQYSYLSPFEPIRDYINSQLACQASPPRPSVHYRDRQSSFTLLVPIPLSPDLVLIQYTPELYSLTSELPPLLLNRESLTISQKC